MTKPKKPDELSVTALWRDASGNFLNISEKAFDWAALHHRRKRMGAKPFKDWMASDDFKAMVAHDLALDPLSEADQKRSKFQFINPERLRDFIVSGGVGGIKPWHLRLMVRLGKIHKETIKAYEYIVKSGILDKKTIRHLSGLSFQEIRDLPLDTDLHVLDGILSKLAFMYQQIEELKRELIYETDNSEVVGRLAELQEQRDMALEPWRLIYGASMERMVFARSVYNRLHRMHNALPQGVVAHVLAHHCFEDALKIELILNDIERMDGIWDAPPAEVSGLAERFAHAVLELRGEKVAPVSGVDPLARRMAMFAAIVAGERGAEVKDVIKEVPSETEPGIFRRERGWRGTVAHLLGLGGGDPEP